MNPSTPDTHSLDQVEDGLLATRRSLLDRLRSLEDQHCWQEFFDTYGRLIHGVARASGLTDEEAQDVVQDTVITVARNMPEFRYEPQQCGFKTWLLNLTRWRIIDRVRARRSHPLPAQTLEPHAESAALPEEVADPAVSDLDRLWDAEWAEHLVGIATQRVKKRVSPKQFQMFYLHVLKELPVRDVARRLGVNVGQVYLAKHRVGRYWRRELQALQASAH